MIQEAYAQGVSTRSVDELVQAMGMSGISKSQADGSVEWVPWGRRKEREGHLPATGWARVDSISAGKWARFHPREVWIVVERFMVWSVVIVTFPLCSKHALTNS
ncbi:hypothetical protein SAMN05216229_104318 [Geopseudomonas sagittaria]|uniref:Transposase n=1 Tax=Geopseudomonas sagittaria TaxID=1135990 RepID=A0A1I5SDX9_9GAMM|nr:hypothetical protein SAMN05216229_104318 [Pseudomonas sagittaria]